MVAWFQVRDFVEIACKRMSAVPTGLRRIVWDGDPTLKRGANEHCAYGAGAGGVRCVCGAGYECGLRLRRGFGV